MKRWITIGILAGLCLSVFLLFSNTNAQLYVVKAEINSTQTELELTKGELDYTKTELGSTKEELGSAETELGSTKEELGYTKTELDSTKGDLDYTKIELDSTKGELDYTKTELDSTKEELGSAETELTSTLDTLSTIQDELDISRDELVGREIELTDLKIGYEGLMTGHGYTIKDPTYSEMMHFLRIDDTDRAEYTEGEYECTEFSADLCNRAEEEGIRCAYVMIRFPGEIGHAIAAFNTIDKGLTYIEPQTDDLVGVEIGKYLHECVVPEAGYYYEKPDFDDTIEEVLIVW